MTQWPDLTGYARDAALVLGVAGACGRAGKNGRLWLVRCACGAEFTRRTTALKDARYKLRCPTCRRAAISEKLTGRVVGHGLSRAADGRHAPLYRLWIGIRERCYRRSNKSFKHYGGRGVRMHDDWLHDFPAFATYIAETLGERPSTDHSIDRMDNDGHYEPGNLRWATPDQQVGNRRPHRAAQRSGRRYLAPLVVGVDVHMLRKS